MTYIVTKAMPIHNMCIGINVRIIQIYTQKCTNTHKYTHTLNNHYIHTYIQAHTLCLHIQKIFTGLEYYIGYVHMLEQQIIKLGMHRVS